MKVVQCLTHSSLGGGQQIVYNLVKHLRTVAPDIESSIVLPAGGPYCERFRNLGVEIHECAMNTLSSSQTRSLEDVLASAHPSIIHSHGKGAGYHARKIRVNGLRHVHSYHGYHPPEGMLASFIYRTLEWNLLRSTDAVANVSESERDEVIREYPSVREKATVIQNVIDREALTESVKDLLPADVEEFLSPNRGKFVLVSIGRYDAVKNYALAVAACIEAMRRNQDVVWIIAGLPKEAAVLGPIRDQFPSRVHASGMVENPSPILSRANALLMTSRKEGSPLAILEAQALGIPVIASKAQGVTELIADGKDGLLSEPNVANLAQAIDALARDKELQTKLSNGAIAKDKTRDINAWASSYARLYGRVCGN